ncbi:MAG: ATP-binding protein, partial [Cyclobacteriaceae bacterium]
MAKVNFRTNVLLKSIIGKDLITDDSIAVLELVKNSFDAGSNDAKVIFRNILHGQSSKEYKRSNESKIIIRDEGSGMSQYDLINKWLNIAYSEKKNKKEEHKRHLAGNKGVGRFSCDRLGKKLVIYTKKIDEPLLKLS